MRQSEKHATLSTAHLTIALVRLRSHEDYLVETETEKMACRRADGCLTTPKPGDLVLVAIHGVNRAWILSVLEKAEPGRTVIGCPEGLEIKTGREGLKISGEVIELTAGREISTQAPEWSLTTARGSVKSRDFSFLAQTISGSAGRIRLWADAWESKVEKLVQRVGHAFRHVRGLDKLTAGRVRTDIEQTWDLNTENARIRAAVKVHVDAEKIDLG